MRRGPKGWSWGAGTVSPPGAVIPLLAVFMCTTWWNWGRVHRHRTTSHRSSPLPTAPNHHPTQSENKENDKDWVGMVGGPGEEGRPSSGTPTRPQLHQVVHMTPPGPLRRGKPFFASMPYIPIASVLPSHLFSNPWGQLTLIPLIEPYAQ